MILFQLDRYLVSVSNLSSLYFWFNCKFILYPFLLYLYFIFIPSLSCFFFALPFLYLGSTIHSPYFCPAPSLFYFNSSLIIFLVFLSLSHSYFYSFFILIIFQLYPYFIFVSTISLSYFCSVPSLLYLYFNPILIIFLVQLNFVISIFSRFWFNLYLVSILSLPLLMSVTTLS